MKKSRFERNAVLTSIVALSGIVGTAALAAQFTGRGYTNPGGGGATPSASSSPSSPTPSSTPSATASATAGPTAPEVYTATLAGLNGSGAAATARFVLQNDTVSVNIDGTGFDPATVHPQALHAGSQCATTSGDANGDGFVDALEAVVVSGPPTFPLTLVLGTIPPGAGGSGAADSSSLYPVSTAEGNLFYSASLPLSTFLQDLNAGEPFTPASTTPSGTPTETPSGTPSGAPSASPSGSPSGEPSSLPSTTPSATPSASATPSPSPSATAQAGSTLSAIIGRVIQINGVGTDRSLPATVQTSGRTLTPQEALPVACGTIQQVQQ